MPKGAWKEYFSFSKKQRVIVLILLALVVGFIALPYYSKPVFAKPIVDSTTQNQLGYMAEKSHYKTDDSTGEPVYDSSTTRTSRSYYKKPEHTLFYFDPNTIDAAGWARLGFRDKTIQNILHYRQTVGKFDAPEDIKNVPRIRKKSVDKILPFVRIGMPQQQLTALNKNIVTATAADEDDEPDDNKTYKPVDINTATAADFSSLPGINTALANRIVHYRQSLNGFKSIDDVAKTYGLPDSTFKKMRPYLSITPQ